MRALTHRGLLDILRCPLIMAAHGPREGVRFHEVRTTCDGTFHCLGDLQMTTTTKTRGIDVQSVCLADNRAHFEEDCVSFWLER